MEWERISKGIHSAENAKVECRRGGWGIEFKMNSKRPWAAFYKGYALLTKNGNVRTFASSAAAKAAIEKEASNA